MLIDRVIILHRKAETAELRGIALRIEVSVPGQPQSANVGGPVAAEPKMHFGVFCSKRFW
jgi:hypothetical protein